jgi:type IV pilus assembly protein PilC
MPENIGPLSLVVLIFPGIALRLALRILYGPRARVANDPLRTTLSIASILMIVLAVGGVLVALTGPAIVPLGVVGFVAALMIHDRLRRAEHRALLWSLTVAAQKGIPLGEAARAFADESTGDSGSRALRLAQAVEAGQPLSAAVARARLRMSPAMRLAVGLGERLGALGPAMKQQLDDSQQADAALHNTIGRFVYLGALLVAFSGIMTFVMLKIVPVFERMFEEFELELPAPTRLVIDISSFVVGYAWPFLLLAALVVSLAIAGFFVLSVMGVVEHAAPLLGEDLRRRPQRTTAGLVLRILLAIGVVLLALLFFPIFWLVVFAPLAAYYAGLFPRDLPIVWRLFRRYDGALVMRGLALAVRRGLPLETAIDAVGLSYPIWHIALLLARVRREIAGGMAWTDSLRGAKLISPADAAVLAAAQRVGNLPWALEEMADSVIRRQTQRVQLAMNLIFPPAMLLVGIAVGLFAYGLFAPLVSLIDGLA